jgi:Zn-dependent protease
MNCPVKKILRFVGQAACLLLVAAGLLAALFATFCLLAMLIVWFQEGTLQPADWPIVAGGVKSLVGSGVLIGVAWWLRGKIVPNPTGDNSFRLVESKSGHLEKLVQNVIAIGSFVILATWLWPRVPGNFIMKIPAIGGWLVTGFLGCHACIALHELGHLAAAWLVGFDLRKIQVGMGPVLWSRSFANGLLSEWRVWPQVGFMFATPRKTEGFRARQSFFVAGGPLANLIILLATYQLIMHVFGGVVAALGQGPGGLMAFALFWWMALATVGGLIPHKIRLDRQEIWNDGYWLLRLWTGFGADVTELARNSNWREYLDLLQSDGPRGVVPLEPSSSRTLQEQRELLSSRLLRKGSITFGPLA